MSPCSWGYGATESLPAAAIVGQSMVDVSIGQFIFGTKNNKQNMFVIDFVNTYNPCGSGNVTGEGPLAHPNEIFISIFRARLSATVRALFPPQIGQKTPPTGCLGLAGVTSREFPRSLLEPLTEPCVETEAQDPVCQGTGISTAKETGVVISQQTAIAGRIAGQDGNSRHQRLTDHVGSPLLHGRMKQQMGTGEITAHSRWLDDAEPAPARFCAGRALGSSLPTCIESPAQMDHLDPAPIR